MRPASEFQAILDNLFKKDQAGAGHEFQQKFETHSTTAAHDDLMSRLFFGQDVFRAKAFNNRAYKTEPKKQPEDIPPTQSRQKPEPQTEFESHHKAASSEPLKAPEPPMPPKPRVRRKLNKDQLSALVLFAQYGETQIDDASTVEEIKSAYRKLARRFHPDRGFKSDGPFKAISMAYKKLLI